MTNEEVAIKLTEHHEEIGSLKHRMNKCEEDNNRLNRMATSIEKMAVSMEYMAKEQKRQADEQTKQGERLEKLEHEPAENMKYYKRTIVSCIITTILGAILGAIIMSIIK